MGITIFSASCQHDSFAVNAFVDVIRKFGGPSYDFTLRETQTNEIIDDIAKLKSEIGVLYLSGKNEKMTIGYVMRKGVSPSRYAKAYIAALLRHCKKSP